MKITQKSFFENAPEFSKAVVAEVGGWQECTQLAREVTEHGADSGTGGFIYYSDTVPFARKNLNEIMRYATEQAEDFNQSLFAMLSSFKCMEGLSENEIASAIYDVHDSYGKVVLNCLAWYALEETARAYTDMEES